MALGSAAIGSLNLRLARAICFGWATRYLRSMFERGIERPRFCAQCGAPIVVADANFCKNCGAPLATGLIVNSSITGRARVAMVLSIVPGLGHLYKGQWLRGFLWFIFVTAFYSSNPLLGFLLHLICVINAGVSGTRHWVEIGKMRKLRGRPPRRSRQVPI